jgi:hypothetical protein
VAVVDANRSAEAIQTEIQQLITPLLVERS